MDISVYLYSHLYIFLSVSIYMDIYYRNWLMLLWRLRRPTACCLHAGDPGKLVVGSRLSLNICRPKS